jgi:hypothetical protein
VVCVCVCVCVRARARSKRVTQMKEIHDQTLTHLGDSKGVVEVSNRVAGPERLIVDQIRFVRVNQSVERHPIDPALLKVNHVHAPEVSAHQATTSVG